MGFKLWMLIGGSKCALRFRRPHEDFYLNMGAGRYVAEHCMVVVVATVVVQRKEGGGEGLPKILVVRGI